MRSARAERLDDADVSVEAVLLLVEDEVSLFIVVDEEELGDVLDVPLVVPLAPIDDVSLDELGLVEELVDEEVLGAVLDVPPALLLVSLFVERLLPPPPAVEALPLPLVCATAMPPMASAAAAANVVSVFLVVVMCIAP